MTEAPASTWWSPGRVNLIGEHTDYNAGLALPFAIDRGTTVTAVADGSTRVRVRSSAASGTAEVTLDALAEGVPPGVPGWCRYPLGVAWALLAAGVSLVGADLSVASDLPIGAGLSSSASLEVATALALASLAGEELDRATLVAVCHRAETEAVGAPVGLLDHLAVLHARPGHATLVDFSSMAVSAIPLAVGPVAVVDTGVRHDNAGDSYRARRAECEAAAAAVGVDHLRHATFEPVDPVLRRRARHVATEDRRVAEAARRLAAGEPVGDLLTDSHRSLRDDFEASCPELDVAVDAALGAGAAGARMTGAGFGGCAVVLGLEPGPLGAAVGAAFAARGWAPPSVLPVVAAGGPRRLPLDPSR